MWRNYHLAHGYNWNLTATRPPPSPPDFHAVSDPVVGEAADLDRPLLLDLHRAEEGPPHPILKGQRSV